MILYLEENENPENKISRECQRVLYNIGSLNITEPGINDELSVHIISALGEIAQDCINKSASDGRKTIIATSIRRIEDLSILAYNKKMRGYSKI